jgi:protein subunit release factor A
MGREKLFSVSIKDCRVEEIASTGGGGGQHKNRRHTAIRITHPPSGAVGYSADERDQLRNKRAAFRRMAETKQFQAWNKRVAAELITGKSIEDRVEEALRPENIKMEVKQDGKWTEVQSLPVGEHQD